MLSGIVKGMRRRRPGPGADWLLLLGGVVDEGGGGGCGRGFGGGRMEDVPEDGPPLEEEAAGGVDGDGVGGDLALGDEGLGGGLQVALHQVVIDVDVEHLIGLPVGPRHGLIDLAIDPRTQTRLQPTGEGSY